MTGTLMGAAAAVCQDGIMAALWAITCMNTAAEEAEKDCPGPGTFRVRLMDALSHHDGTTLAARFKGKRL